MQLVAYGAQDIYLTGNPQITFFKVVYRRHTNFSMESIQQTLNGSSTAALGSTATCTISRNGDLVYKIYVSESDSTTTTNGSALVKDVELEIGGQKIDKHTTEWMNIWTELSTPESKAIGLKAMQCDIGTQGSTGVNMTQVPLQFWFCRNPGLALPLIALQYHEVKLKFTWGVSAPSPQVWCDYIYLDTDERRRFAQVSHEYLIEQLQEESISTGGGDKKINFNHPVKELVWVMDTPVKDTKYQLKLNGHDRFAAQEEEYFQLRQPFDYHTAVPKQNLSTAAQLTTIDRQTQLIKIDSAAADDGLLSTVLSGKNDAENSASNLFYDQDEGYIYLNGASTDPVAGTTKGFLNVGDQIAITVSVASGDTLSGLAGFTYYATVTVAGVQFSGASAKKYLKVGITAPTSADLTPLIWTGDTGDNGSYFVHKVFNGNSAQARTSQMTKKINVYSFALKPEEHQPSGTCNFSRIDNAQLHISTSNGAGKIYAVNYNVLRIMSGMGGLAYSN